jgi:hypothetical protein
VRKLFLAFGGEEVELHADATLTRPATEGDPSVVASDADIFNVEPSPVAPTHTGEDQAVEEGGKTVPSPHSSAECKPSAPMLVGMYEFGKLAGYSEACSDIFAVFPDGESRAIIIGLLSEKAPTILTGLMKGRQ